MSCRAARSSICLAALLLALSAVAAAAAEKPAAPVTEPTPKTLNWKVADVDREAVVYAPAKPNEPKPADAKRPLVITFHGHFGRGPQVARGLPFHKLWPEAVCAYPQGLPTPSPLIDAEGKGTGWQKFVGDQGDRDLAFFDAMLKTLVTEYGVDERRVYVAGHSNGGYFAYLLTAARGDKLTAIAPIAAAVNPRDKGQTAMPVLHVAGEADKIVPFRVQQATIERVKKVNGCDAEGKPAGKLCTAYTSAKGPPVVTMIHPGGHEVPAEAAARIVEFFKEQGPRK